MHYKKPVSRATHRGNDFLKRYSYTLFITVLLIGLLFGQQVFALNSGMTASTSFNSSSQISALGIKAQSSIRQLIKGIEAFANEDYALASRQFIPLARQGIGEAQFYMGLMHDSGLGVEKDVVRAFKYYKDAAAEGHAGAQHNLAVAYASGEGVSVNSERALHWWHSAARQGNADAQYNLGIVYAVGKLGVSPDLEQAKKWWRRAAISGDAMAQYNLGILYVKGNDSVRSYCEAARWWEKSAQKGLSQAAVALEAIKNKKDYYACW